MTTHETNQTTNDKLGLLSEVEINEEALGDVSGGFAFPPRKPKQMIRKNGTVVNLPTDGGATGSW